MSFSLKYICVYENKIFIKIDIFYDVHGPTIFHDGPALRNEHMYKGT